MEKEVRSGILYVQKVSGLVKKFQKRYVALYKRSSHGVSRLEVFDHKEQFDKRVKSGKKHLITLDSCATITRKSIPDGKKMEYQIQLTFHDNKEQLLQADSDEDMELWYAAISSVIFGSGGLMDNVIYQEYEEDGYDVVIKQNEVVMKLNLSGLYSLVVSGEDVEIRDKETKKVVTKWPLQLLRKYGRDKQEFSLEAGRRCPTGPGMFYFITDHYNEIFQEVDNKVRNLAERSRAHSTSSGKAAASPTFSGNPPDSPLPLSPVPPSPFFKEECEYDNPLDVRRSAPTSEESIYNEPINSQPSSKIPKKGKRPTSPKQLKPENATKGPEKPERAQQMKPPVFGFGKKDKKNKPAAKNLPPSPVPPPTHIEEVTYAEALPMGGKIAAGDTQEYGRLDFEGKRFSGTSGDSQYDSLNVGWKNSTEESEYATAGSLNQRMSGLSTDDDVYDRVQR